jgi:hypothetical protein
VSDQLSLARAWAREMISGQLSAIEGARRIGEQVSEGFEYLAVFEELAGEWEGGDREECEARMLEQASLLLADTA